MRKCNKKILDQILVFFLCDRKKRTRTKVQGCLKQFEIRIKEQVVRVKRRRNSESEMKNEEILKSQKMDAER